MTDTLTAFQINAIREFVAEFAITDWQPYACEGGINAMQTYIRDMLTHIETLETALALYADPAIWVTTPGMGTAVAWATAGGRSASRANADRGEWARKALKGRGG